MESKPVEENLDQKPAEEEKVELSAEE